MAKAKRGWSSRFVGAVALVVPIAGAIAAVVSTKGLLFPKYTASDLTVSVSHVSDVDATLLMADADTGQDLLIVVDVVVAKADAGSARDCKGQLIYNIGGVKGTLESVNDDKAHSPSHFKVPEYAKSTPITLNFHLSEYQKAPKGFQYDFQISCDGTITKAVPVTYYFIPLLEENGG